MDVSAFTALARTEFMQGKLAADAKPLPAAFESFLTRMPSTVKVETHTYLSNLPRLREFRGYTPGVRLTNTPYTVANKEYRIGPVTVRTTDIDDDQVGGYMLSIKGLPDQGKKDIGFRILDQLVGGDTTVGFDGTNFFADSHVVGSGDNTISEDNASNDGASHAIIALVTTNPTIKPMIFQDRESLTNLQTDAGTPGAMKQKEYEYWCDCRFGLAYGFWWDAIKVTITDTPTLTELQSTIRDIINRFRTFTLPKGADFDKTLTVHEGWVPDPTNFTLLCNMALGELLRTVKVSELIGSGTGGAVVTNTYKDMFTLLPTSALGN